MGRGIGDTQFSFKKNDEKKILKFYSENLSRNLFWVNLQPRVVVGGGGWDGWFITLYEKLESLRETIKLKNYFMKQEIQVKITRW